MLWEVEKATYRSFHLLMKAAVALYPMRVPGVLLGPDSSLQIAENVALRGFKRPLLVTDPTIVQLGLTGGLVRALEAQGTPCFVYDNVEPNPTIQNVEGGVVQYREHQCDCLIGFGGGSPMDCAKAIGARIGNPLLSLRQMKGYLRVVLPIPALFAIPTTAGTGSEATLAAVIKSPAHHEKFAINDPKLVPLLAALDPKLLVGLPPPITAATGMDALTHAVEAFVSTNASPFTNQHAIRAVKLIFEYLPVCYERGDDLNARTQVAIASFCAGVAFTRAFIGYVHAIAHNVGAMYGVAHGLANAIALTPVLRFYGDAAVDKLARLAVECDLGSPSDSSRALAAKFIDRIDAMNHAMGIATTMPHLKHKDVAQLAKQVLNEAHPDYPVPAIMTLAQCEALLAAMVQP